MNKTLQLFLISEITSYKSSALFWIDNVFYTTVWTGGFKNQFNNMWTWCKRFNPNSFGFRKIEGHYNYTENHEAFNITEYDYDSCSKFAFAFNGNFFCMDEKTDRKTVCESTSNVTYADLVKL
jgi:hypothetical protein